MKNTGLVLFFLLIMVFLAGCSATSNTDTTTTTATTTTTIIMTTTMTNTTTTTTALIPDRAAYSSGVGTIEGTCCFDFDEGITTDEAYGADVWWEQLSDVVRYLVPKNDALFNVAGTVEYETATYEAVSTAALTSETIDGSDNSNNQLTNDTVVYGRTSAGRYTKFQVLNYGYNLTIRWKTYE